MAEMVKEKTPFKNSKDYNACSLNSFFFFYRCTRETLLKTTVVFIIIIIIIIFSPLYLYNASTL